MRDDQSLPPPLPGLVLRQARRAWMHGLMPATPSLVRVEAGVKEVLAAGHTLRVGPGNFVLLPEGLPLSICNIPDAGGSYIARALPLPRIAVERALARKPDLPRPRDRLPQMLPALPEAALTLFLDLFAPSRLQSLPADLIDLKLEELALWLALIGVTLAPEGPARLADRVRLLIAADPAADWSAARLARQLALSEATLRRRLAGENDGFGQILRDVRLTHALGLLQTTGFSVARVAAEAGYASPQQFAARFRSRFGLAPHEIRQPEPPIDRFGAKLAQAGADAGQATA